MDIKSKIKLRLLQQLTCNRSEVKSAADIELHELEPSLQENSMSPSVSTVTVSCTCKMSMSISWLASRLDVPDVDGTWFIFNNLCDIDWSNLKSKIKFSKCIDSKISILLFQMLQWMMHGCMIWYASAENYILNKIMSNFNKLINVTCCHAQNYRNS